jgi:hypothetical protein
MGANRIQTLRLANVAFFAFVMNVGVGCVDGLFDVPPPNDPQKLEDAGGSDFVDSVESCRENCDRVLACPEMSDLCSGVPEDWKDSCHSGCESGTQFLDRTMSQDCRSDTDAFFTTFPNVELRCSCRKACADVASCATDWERTCSSGFQVDAFQEKCTEKCEEATSSVSDLPESCRSRVAHVIRDVPDVAAACFCSRFKSVCGSDEAGECEERFREADPGMEDMPEGATQACYLHHLQLADTEPEERERHCAYASGVEGCL